MHSGQPDNPPAVAHANVSTRVTGRRPAFDWSKNGRVGSLLLGGLLLGADVEVAEDERVLLVGDDAEPVT